MMAEALPILVAEGVTSGYGEVPVVEDVSIHIGQDEIVTIIGPNGAGKSTVLKALFGFLPVWQGRVSLAGDDVTGLAPELLVCRGIAFVPQTENIFPSLTIRENLTMGGITRADGVEERISWVFELFPVLAERPRERAGRLSGGQRQTLAIARALMLEPRILLLDEPSASLSPKMVETVLANVVEINRRGTAVLMVEQRARQALAISDRGYVLANGRNRLEGPALDLLASDEVRRLYLGE
ncbi:MAG TPA: ABC transporter ATP-binding protein [Thermomicrobiales bacterium]|jgi:ABC-type branched-subunit amino acid transport system ATPase component|nr:ABC transporter ATP-binding protein [Thermomicrobiales bacterium]